MTTLGQGLAGTIGDEDPDRTQLSRRLGPVLRLALAAMLALAGLAIACDRPAPDRCETIVALEPPAIVEDWLVTRVHIELDSERPAWVYVEYSIVYRDASGARRKEPGVLRERLDPGVHRRTSRDVVPVAPAEIVSIRVHETSCTHVEGVTRPEE